MHASLACTMLAEYNGKCVDEHMPKLKDLKINPLIGDQADIPTLKRWITQSGGKFDLIVDDGGHTSMQVSFSNHNTLQRHAP